MRHVTSPSRMQGLTLVELMVALTLGLIVIGAVIAVFTSNNKNYQQNEALATVQDNARFALDLLSRDLAMAGYWGGVRPVDAGDNVRVSIAASSAVSKTGVDSDCGPAVEAADYFWLFDVGTPIVFRDHSKGLSTISTDFRCLLPADIQDNTDVVMIRRVSGQPAYSDPTNGIVSSLMANRFYVKTNQNIASLYRAGASFSIANPSDCPDSTGVSAVCPPSATPVQVYAYTPQIYYIRNYLRTAGDGLPILCRRYLRDDTSDVPTMFEDCLAEGVENLQIEWGISDGGANSAVNTYVRNPTALQLTQALTARISILVRSVNKNVASSSDAKTFVLAGYTVPAQAGVLRRAFSTTVELKNLRP